MDAAERRPTNLLPENHMSPSFRSSSPIVACLIHLAACGAQPAAPDAIPDAAPDAPTSTVPVSPAGVFAVTSTLDFEVPPAAAPVLAMLSAATDGPDDPARYLLDTMIAALPDGPVKTIAQGAAPYLAAYLSARLDDLAPQLATRIAALADGLARIAGHLGTVETLQIDADGAAVRTITGVRFDLGTAPVAVSFADGGLPDIASSLRVALDASGRLMLGSHMHAWPYGEVLRLGLDRAVVVSVVPGARDLAGALSALVDCDRLGTLIADRIGVGSASPYRVACRAGMVAIASEIYGWLAAIDDAPLIVDVVGAATGVDGDGDGAMDEVHAGIWSGTLRSGSSQVPLAAARFTGRAGFPPALAPR
jgi:hypothetical protein